MRKVLIVVTAGAALWAGGGQALKYLSLPLAEPGGPAADDGPKAGPALIVCSGRVETVRGEIDVTPQIAGTLAEVCITDGAAVRRGQILAVLEGGREAAEVQGAEAALAVARARLTQLRAGPGKEEIDQALNEVRAVQAQLDAEVRSNARSSGLLVASAESVEDFDRRQYRVRQLRSQRDSLRKRYEALRRGALPQDVEVARAEVALAAARLTRARVEDSYRTLRAPADGTVLEVYRHAGDSVTTMQPSPVLRLAAAGTVRVRLEVDEADVPRLRAGLTGTFSTRGTPSPAGRLVVKTIIPTFGPKRLFNPDTSARLDTRILDVLCEPQDSRVPLYLGQRVTARFAPAPGPADEPAVARGGPIIVLRRSDARGLGR